MQALVIVSGTRKLDESLIFTDVNGSKFCGLETYFIIVENFE